MLWKIDYNEAGEAKAIFQQTMPQSIQSAEALIHRVYASQGKEVTAIKLIAEVVL